MPDIDKRILELAEQAQQDIIPYFSRIDDIAQKNTEKVLNAFQKNRVSDTLFAGTTGYGYDDKGRDVLDSIYADIFGTEKGLVRISFVNGTHAISSALFSNLESGDVLLSAVGAPYDTLAGAIGINGRKRGSLASYGIEYRQAELTEDGKPDIKKICELAADKRVKSVFIQRSRGYSLREPLCTAQIGEIAEAVHRVNPQAAVIVDNCYGEFAEITEPTQVGADLAAGSLIKNPGGGLAPTGGYVVGREDLVEGAAARLTAPGIGGECGSTLGNNRLLYQGLFMAPHVVAQAKKTAVFCARLMELMGFEALPASFAERTDIIQLIKLQNADRLKRFCAGIQSASPVDSFVTPEPWQMPGYDCEVIMAAGAFIQGSSIELSADAPMREPYCVYLQGGLTYEAGKLGIMQAASRLL